MAERASAALAAARAIAGEAARHSARHDRDGSFPTEGMEAIREAGLLAVVIPCTHEGLDLDFLEYTLLLEELGRGDPSLAVAFNMHNIVMGTVADADFSSIPERRTRRQREFRDWVFDQSIASRALFAQATSEPEIGFDLSRLKTTYTREGDAYVLAGCKSFVSMATIADWFVVAARERGTPLGEPASVSHFVVGRDAPGVVIDRTWDSLGMRATDSQTVTFDECRVPQAQLFFGLEGVGTSPTTAHSHWTIGSYVGAYLGLCDTIFDEAVRYVVDSGRHGSASGAVVVHRLGEMSMRLETARAVTYEAARVVVSARGSSAAQQAMYRAKYVVGDTAAWLAANAINVCGGSAVSRGHTLERHYRDAICAGLMPTRSDECLLRLGAAAVDAAVELDVPDA